MLAAVGVCCAVHLGVIGVVAGWLAPTWPPAAVAAMVAVGTGVVLWRRSRCRPAAAAALGERTRR